MGWRLGLGPGPKPGPKGARFERGGIGGGHIIDGPAAAGWAAAAAGPAQQQLVRPKGQISAIVIIGLGLHGVGLGDCRSSAPSFPHYCQKLRRRRQGGGGGGLLLGRLVGMARPSWQLDWKKKLLLPQLGAGLPDQIH